MCRLQCKGPNMGLCEFGVLHLSELLWRAPLVGCTLLKGQVHDLGHLAPRAGCLCSEHGEQKVKFIS